MDAAELGGIADYRVSVSPWFQRWNQRRFVTVRHKHDWLNWTRWLRYCTACLVARPIRLTKYESEGHAE